MDYEKFLERLEKELVVTLGCTESIAIAFAAALAKNHVKGEIVTSVRVLASANVIKNVMAVVIPGTQGSGVNLAAALGVLAGDFSKGLEVLTGLTPGDVEKAKRMRVIADPLGLGRRREDELGSSGLGCREDL